MSQGTSPRLAASSKGDRLSQWLCGTTPVIHLKREKDRNWNLNMAGAEAERFGAAQLLHKQEVLHEWKSVSKTIGSKVVYVVEPSSAARDRVKVLSRLQRGHTLLLLVLRVMIDGEWVEFPFYRSPARFKAFSRRRGRACKERFPLSDSPPPPPVKEEPSPNQKRRIRPPQTQLSDSPVKEELSSKRIRLREPTATVKKAKLEQVEQSSVPTTVAAMSALPELPEATTSSEHTSSCGTLGGCVQSVKDECVQSVKDECMQSVKDEEQVPFPFLREPPMFPALHLLQPMGVSQRMQQLVSQRCLGRADLIGQYEKIIALAQYEIDQLVSQPVFPGGQPVKQELIPPPQEDDISISDFLKNDELDD